MRQPQQYHSIASNITSYIVNGVRYNQEDQGILDYLHQLLLQIIQLLVLLPFIH